MLQPGRARSGVSVHQLRVRGELRGAAGPRQTMGAGGEQGGGGGLPVPPRPGKQVTPYQLGKQTPKQSVGLDFDEPDTLSYKK